MKKKKKATKKSKYHQKVKITVDYESALRLLFKPEIAEKLLKAKGK